MKKVMTIIGAVFFASLILSSCGGKDSKDDGAKVEDQAASPSEQDASTTQEDASTTGTEPSGTENEPSAETEEPESMDGVTDAANKTVEDAKKNASEETSKKVYRQGYSDGQTGYGLPASERGSASEFYMSRGYNYSSADYYVYEMGYNDGVYGRN